MAKLTGGDKLKAAMDRIGAKLKNATKVDIGFLEGATYPDGTPVAMVAAIQEFGAPQAKIPPRPYFRSMIAKKSGEWPDAIAEDLKQTGLDARATLARAGSAISAQLQESIIETMAPPLSAVTLMLRKMKADNPDLKITGATVGEAARRVAAGEQATGVSTKPLVDSGTMLRAVDYEVKS